jgi:hypothetical protein
VFNLGQIRWAVKRFLRGAAVGVRTAVEMWHNAKVVRDMAARMVFPGDNPFDLSDL